MTKKAHDAAFIGSNYIAMPYAFRQGGVVAGSIGLCIIAWVTGYCCNLLVKCKRKVCDQQHHAGPLCRLTQLLYRWSCPIPRFKPTAMWRFMCGGRLAVC